MRCGSICLFSRVVWQFPLFSGQVIWSIHFHPSTAAQQRTGGGCRKVYPYVYIYKTFIALRASLTIRPQHLSVELVRKSLGSSSSFPPLSLSLFLDLAQRQSTIVDLFGFGLSHGFLRIRIGFWGLPRCQQIQVMSPTSTTWLATKIQRDRRRKESTIAQTQ